jgi:hypothetical protein
MNVIQPKQKLSTSASNTVKNKLKAFALMDVFLNYYLGAVDFEKEYMNEEFNATMDIATEEFEGSEKQIAKFKKNANQNFKKELKAKDDKRNRFETLINNELQAFTGSSEYMKSLISNLNDTVERFLSKALVFNDDSQNYGILQNEPFFMLTYAEYATDKDLTVTEVKKMVKAKELEVVEYKSQQFIKI